MDGDSSAKFIGSLTKFLQSLCNGYVEFQRGVELVGHIYLSIDTGEKVDYILHEKVSKNDENSVTFVSNSFHAQPQDKDKAKEPPATGNAKAGKSENLQDDDDDDDDDDIMIVDQSSQGVIGSTNSGSISSRGVKRMSSPGLDHRHGQRVRISLGSSSAHNMSGHSYGSGNRQHSGRPSATVTSQGASQNENLNISEVKLEQISKDELLSLASQVGDGTSGPSQTSSAASHSQSQLSGSSRGDAAMWVKQEVPDDGGGTDAGWPQERDDSNSNSGSNLYPVMLHPNPSAFPPSIPGYSGPSGSGNQSAFPMPGSSQDMSGLDPAERIGWTRRCRTSFSHYQIKTLEKEFDQGQYLTRPRRCFLAKKLGLTERHITIWFQNRRQKVKKEQHQGSGEKDFSRPSQPPNQSLWLHDSGSKDFGAYHQSSAQFPPPQSPDVQDLSKHNQSPYQSRPSQSPGSDEIRRYGRSPNQFQPPQSPGVQDLSRPSQSPFHSRPSPSPGYRFGQSPSQSQPSQSPGYRYSHSPSHSQPSQSPGVKDLSMHSQSPSQSLSSQSPDVKEANSFQPPYRSQLPHSPNNRELGNESPKHFLQSQSPCGKDYSQSSNQSLESHSSSGKDFLYGQSPSQPQQAEGAPGKDFSSNNQSPKQFQCRSPSRRDDTNQDQSPDQVD